MAIDEFTWINRCKETWKKQDGPQKIHYSQQAQQKKRGSHSDYIAIDEFMDFYKELDREDIDIMLEVKDKNISCIKCINCTTENLNPERLEREWSRYKYTVLERSILLYKTIENIFMEKESLSAIYFYKLIEESLKNEGDIETYVNALLQVWSNFNHIVTDKERNTFFKNIKRYQLQEIGINKIKNQLKKLAIKYQENYLVNSYYFTI